MVDDIRKKFEAKEICEQWLPHVIYRNNAYRPLQKGSHFSIIAMRLNDSFFAFKSREKEIADLKEIIETLKCCGNCGYEKFQLEECVLVTGNICDNWKINE